MHRWLRSHSVAAMHSQICMQINKIIARAILDISLESCLQFWPDVGANTLLPVLIFHYTNNNNNNNNILKSISSINNN